MSNTERSNLKVTNQPIGKSLTVQINELQNSIKELKELFDAKINTYVTKDEFRANDAEVTEILKNHADAINALQETVNK